MGQEKRKFVIIETHKDIEVDYFITDKDGNWVKAESIQDVDFRGLFHRLIWKVKRHVFKPDQIVIRDKDNISMGNSI